MASPAPSLLSATLAPSSVFFYHFLSIIHLGDTRTWWPQEALGHCDVRVHPLSRGWRPSSGPRPKAGVEAWGPTIQFTHMHTPQRKTLLSIGAGVRFAFQFPRWGSYLLPCIQILVCFTNDVRAELPRANRGQ